MIELRIENLKYEIYQYEKGYDIDSVQVLSNKKQEQKGIHIVSYNVKYDFCQSIVWLKTFLRLKRRKSSN